MRPNRTIEPRSLVFAQRLRDRYLTSPAGSDLAATLLARYGSFRRAERNFPALLYHALTPAAPDAQGLDQQGIPASSQRAPVQSAFATAAASPPVTARPGAMIQRFSLPADAPVQGPSSTREVRPIPRSPMMRHTVASAELPAAISLAGAGRVSASQPPAHEFPQPWNAEADTRVLSSAFMSSPTVNRAASLPAPEFGGPGSTAAMPSPAEIEERARSRSVLHRLPAAMASEAREGEPAQTASGPSGLTLGSFLARMSVLKTSAAQPGLVHRIAGEPMAKNFRAPARARSKGSKALASSRFHIARPLQAPALDGLHPESILSAVRMSPGGGSLVVEGAIVSGALSWAPSVDLTLPLPKAPVAPQAAAAALTSPPQRSLADGAEASAASVHNAVPPVFGPPALSVPEVADKVYRLLERRLMIERERRGVFRL